MPRFLDIDGLEDKIRDFCGNNIGSRKHLIFAGLQLLESKIAIGTHTGVIKGNILAYPADIDTMLTSPSLATVTAVVVIGGMYATLYDGSARERSKLNPQTRFDWAMSCFCTTFTLLWAL